MAFFKNLLTFGAHGRIERKMEEFEDLKVQYESLYYEMDSKRKDVNKTLEKVIRFKVEAVKSLQKSNCKLQTDWATALRWRSPRMARSGGGGATGAGGLDSARPRKPRLLRSKYRA